MPDFGDVTTNAGSGGSPIAVIKVANPTTGNTDAFPVGAISYYVGAGPVTGAMQSVDSTHGLPVQVVSALPAGTNSIGTVVLGAGSAAVGTVIIGAGSAVIGHVIVDSGTVTANQGGAPWSVAGNVASGSADSGNPVKAGGVFNSIAPTLLTGQRGDLQLDANGNLKVLVENATIAVTQSGTWALGASSAVIGHVIVDSGAITANIGTTGGLALDATLTGGSLKAIARGGQKGTTNANADITHTASGLNHEALDVALYDASGNQLGLAATPLRTDPTGTTTQPVSGSVTVSNTVTISGAVTEANLDSSIVAWAGTTAPTKGIGVLGKTNDATAQYQPIPEGAGGRSVIIEGFAGGTPAPVVITAGSAVMGHVIVDSGTVTANQGGAPWSFVGNVASGAADSGNPVKVGAVYNSVAPTFTTGQRGDLQLDSAGRLMVNVAAGGGSGGTSSSFSAAFPATGTAAGASDGTNMKPLLVDASGFLKVNVAAGGGSGGTSSSFGVAFPATGTAIGASDGTNMKALLVNASGLLKVDGSGVTQPVSGTITANIGTTNGLALDATLTGGTAKTIARGGQKGTTNTNADITHTPSGANHEALDVALYDGSGNQIGTATAPVRVDPTGTTTQPVTVSNTPSVAQSGAWTVTANAGTGTFIVGQSTASNLNAQVQGAAASGAAKAGNPVQVGGVFNTTQPTVATGQAVDLQATAHGGLIVATGADAFHATIDNATLAVTQSGTWSLAANQTVNLAQIAGTTTSVNEGSSDAGTQRVAIGTDDSILTDSRWSSADANLHNVKTSAGRVFSIEVTNNGATPVYLRLYNKASAPVAGTDAALIVRRYIIPGASGSTGAGFVREFPKGRYFNTGIGYDLTGAAGDTDATAIAANQCAINIDYK